MPIQVNITQPNGVVTSYHIVGSVQINPNNPVTAAGSSGAFQMNSYLSSAAYQAGDQPVNVENIDVSGMLGSPVNFTNFILNLVPGLEGYVISSLPQFSGGTIVG